MSKLELRSGEIEKLKTRLRSSIPNKEANFITIILHLGKGWSYSKILESIPEINSSIITTAEKHYREKGIESFLKFAKNY